MAADPQIVVVGSTMSGGGFNNCMATTDGDAALEALHGGKFWLSGGDIWGPYRSAVAAGVSKRMLEWAPGFGGLTDSGGFVCSGMEFSRTKQGWAYFFASNQAGSGKVWLSKDYGKSWKGYTTGGLGNYGGSHPRGDGKTIVARNNGTADQLFLASAKGGYVCQSIENNNTWVRVGSFTDAVGVAVDPNSNQVYWSVRAGTTSLGLWRADIATNGAITNVTHLGTDSLMQECVTLDQAGTTVVFGVGGAGGSANIWEFRAGNFKSIKGNLPSNGTIAAVDAYVASGTTHVFVGYTNASSSSSIWHTSYANGAAPASPTWTALDTASRIQSPMDIIGQDATYEWWLIQAQAPYKLGNAEWDCSQLIALPSKEVVICGRSAMYYLPDWSDTSKWRVSSKGINGSEAGRVTADVRSKARKYCSGDTDWTMMSFADGGESEMPRCHEPNEGQARFVSFDDNGGVYTGGEGDPSNHYNTTSGWCAYHPDPFNRSYGRGATGGTSDWKKIDLPLAKPPTAGATALLPTTKDGSGRKIHRLLVVLLNTSGIWRRVDAVGTRAGNGDVLTWTQVDGWGSVRKAVASGIGWKPDCCIGTLTSDNGSGGGVGYVYAYWGADLFRSADLGMTWTNVLTISAGNDLEQSMHNDQLNKPDRIYIVGDSKLYRIEDARSGNPVTKIDITPAGFNHPGPVAIDGSVVTNGFGRVWCCNNGSNATTDLSKLSYSDDGGTTWHSSGGVDYNTTVRRAREIAASGGSVMIASIQGGAKTGVALAAPPTDTTKPSPNPMTGISTALVDGTTIRVSFDPATDLESGMKQYNIYEATSLGGTYTKIATADPTADFFDVTGYGVGVTRWYKVTAVDFALNETNLQTVGIQGGPTTTPPGTAPNPPTGGSRTYSALTKSVAVSWTASTTVSPAVTYNVRKNGVDIATGVAGTSYTDPDVELGQTLNYEVLAINTNGQSTVLQLTALTIPATDTTAPNPTATPGVAGAVQNITATVQGTTITVSWDPSDDAESGMGGYRVLRSTTLGGTYSQVGGDLPPGQTSFVDAGLSATTAYYYKVIAFDASAAHNASAAQASGAGPFTTGTAGAAPAAPTNGASSFDRTTQSVTLTWDASTTAGVNYQIERGGTVIASGITSLNFTDTSVAFATVYAYNVYALNPATGGKSSALAIGITTPAQYVAPSVPPNLVGNPFSPNETDISWDASQPGSAPVAGYRLYRALTAGGTYTQIGGDLTATSYHDSGLNPSTAYFYKVHAFSVQASNTDSADAGPVEVDTLAATSQDVPLAVAQVTVGQSGVAPLKTIIDFRASQNWTAIVIDWNNGFVDTINYPVSLATQTFTPDPPLNAGEQFQYDVVATPYNGTLAGLPITIPIDVFAPDDEQTINYQWPKPPPGIFVEDIGPIIRAAMDAQDQDLKALADQVVGGGAPDATTSSKGIIQLAGDLAGTAASPTVPGLALKLTASSNLSDLASAATARSNLGLGTAATTASTAYDAAGAASAVQALAALRASNLSDLASASTARSNLGLGTVATLASTAVAQTANNLSDLANAATARSNLGLGTAATLASTAVAQTANNLSDLASASTARTNLGLGTAATQASTAFEAAGNVAAAQRSALNSQTGTTYTLVLTDATKTVEMNNASANTLTVPPNSSVAFTVGDQILVRQMGAGLTTIAQGAGVTIRSRGSALKMGGQYAEAVLTKRATDEWVLSGDIVP